MAYQTSRFTLTSWASRLTFPFDVQVCTCIKTPGKGPERRIIQNAEWRKSRMIGTRQHCIRREWYNIRAGAVLRTSRLAILTVRETWSLAHALVPLILILWQSLVRQPWLCEKHFYFHLASILVSSVLCQLCRKILWLSFRPWKIHKIVSRPRRIASLYVVCCGKKLRLFLLIFFSTRNR